MPYNSMVIQF